MNHEFYNQQSWNAKIPGSVICDFPKLLKDTVVSPGMGVQLPGGVRMGCPRSFTCHLDQGWVLPLGSLRSAQRT